MPLSLSDLKQDLFDSRVSHYTIPETVFGNKHHVLASPSVCMTFHLHFILIQVQTLRHRSMLSLKTVNVASNCPPTFCLKSSPTSVFPFIDPAGLCFSRLSLQYRTWSMFRRILCSKPLCSFACSRKLTVFSIRRGMKAAAGEFRKPSRNMLRTWYRAGVENLTACSESRKSRLYADAMAGTDCGICFSRHSLRAKGNLSRYSYR